MENKEVFIYKATSPSGKVYIGISKDFEKRRKDHIRAAKNPNDPYHNEVFKRAIRKYGNSIKWEVLTKVSSYNEAHSIEKKLIKELNSYGANGYNMTHGGDGNSIAFHTKYTENEVLINAQSYEYKIDWYEHDRNIYLAAKRIDTNLNPGFFNKCCEHFIKKPKSIPVNKKWTVDKIIIEAKKFSSKIEMKEKGKGSYAALNTLRKTNPKLYDQAVSHMERRRG